MQMEQRGRIGGALFLHDSTRVFIMYKPVILESPDTPERAESRGSRIEFAVPACARAAINVRLNLPGPVPSVTSPCNYLGAESSRFPFNYTCNRVKLPACATGFIDEARVTPADQREARETGRAGDDNRATTRTGPS